MVTKRRSRRSDAPCVSAQKRERNGAQPSASRRPSADFIENRRKTWKSHEICNEFCKDSIRTLPQRIGQLKTRKNRKDTLRTLQSWVILRKLLYWPSKNNQNREYQRKCTDFTVKTTMIYLERDKHVFKCMDFIENHRKTRKSHEICNGFCKDILRTLPQRIGKLKTRKNRKDILRTLQNWVILRKFLYWTPAKIIKIVKINENARTLHSKTSMV